MHHFVAYQSVFAHGGVRLVECSLVPRLHCPVFFCTLEKHGHVFPKCKKKTLGPPKCKQHWAVEPGNGARLASFPGRAVRQFSSCVAWEKGYLSLLPSTVYTAASALSSTFLMHLTITRLLAFLMYT